MVRRVSWAMLLVAACGGDDDSTPMDAGMMAMPDAEVDAGPMVELPEVDEPQIDWLDEGAPTLAPPEIPWLEATPLDNFSCADNWAMETSDEGPPHCEPYPGGRSDCGADEARFPGSTACERVGPECPASTFPEDLLGANLFVDSSVTGPGTGTESDPFRLLSDAIAAASDGTVIWLAAGRHIAGVELPAGVTLRGVCTGAELHVASGQSVLSATGAGERSVQDLAIVDATAASAISVEQGAQLSMSGVLIRNHTGAALLVDGAGTSALLEYVSLRGVSQEEAAPAVSVRGGSLDASFLEVRDVSFTAVSVDTGAATLAHVAISDIAPMGDEMPQAFGAVVAGGEMQLDFTVVENKEANGSLAVALTGGALTLTQCLLRRDAPEESLEQTVFRHGINAADDAIARAASTEIIGDNVVGLAGVGTIELDNIIVQGALIALLSEGGGATLQSGWINSCGAGLTAAGEGTMVVRDLRITNINYEDSFDASNGAGQAAICTAGATCTLDRLHVAQVRGAGLISALPGAAMTVNDAVLSDFEMISRSVGGHAVEVLDEAEMTMNRVEVYRAVQQGMLVDGLENAAPAVLNLADVLLEDVESRPSTGQAGEGILVWNAGTIEADRVIVRRARRSGLRAWGIGTIFNARDVLVEEMLPEEATGNLGFGITIYFGAEAAMERVLVRDTLGAGIGVANDTSFADLKDVVIEDIQTWPDGQYGRGIEVVGPSSAYGERLALRRVNDVALWAGGARGALDLEHVSVDGVGPQTCGACPERGDGVSAVSMGRVTLRNFELQNIHRAAVQSACGGEVELFDGAVMSSDVAFNEQDEASMSRADVVVLDDTPESSTEMLSADCL